MIHPTTGIILTNPAVRSLPSPRNCINTPTTFLIILFSPAKPLAPPAIPPAEAPAAGAASPGNALPPRIMPLPLLSCITLIMVACAVCAFTSAIVVPAKRVNRLVTCIIIDANSPTFPPNIDATPAAELIANPNPVSFCEAFPMALRFMSAALARPFCLPSKI